MQTGVQRRDGAWVPDTRTAIDVERLLVWTYHRQKARHLMSPPDRGGGLSSTGDVCRLMAAGGRVDGGGPSPLRLHPDAYAVWLVSRGMADVVWHAETLGRPDPMVGAVPIVVPVLDARGRPRRRYHSWDKHRHYGEVMVVERLSQAQIDAARSRYAAWHADLQTVALLLADSLRTWRVLPTRAPSAPWLTHFDVDVCAAS